MILSGPGGDWVQNTELDDISEGAGSTGAAWQGGRHPQSQVAQGKPWLHIAPRSAIRGFQTVAARAALAALFNTSLSQAKGASEQSDAPWAESRTLERKGPVWSSGHSPMPRVSCGA